MARIAWAVGQHFWCPRNWLRSHVGDGPHWLTLTRAWGKRGFYCECSCGGGHERVTLRALNAFAVSDGLEDEIAGLGIEVPRGFYGHSDYQYS